jgi:hypothetical protein
LEVKLAARKVSNGSFVEFAVSDTDTGIGMIAEQKTKLSRSSARATLRPRSASRHQARPCHHAHAA